MFAACRPFWPCSTSNSTFWFSFSVLYPEDWIALKCAKTSSLPSSGAMKPKPLSALNHLTVPVAITGYSFERSYLVHDCRRRSCVVHPMEHKLRNGNEMSNGQ